MKINNSLYNKYKKLIIIYPIIVILIYLPFNYLKKQKVDSYLKIKTEECDIFYNSIYHKYKKQSDLIFKTLIDQHEIIEIYKLIQTANQEEKNNLRKRLYNLLKINFENLKFFKVKQLHFHLSNNDSFLRMHKPKRFGDNLSSIRSTVSYVNKNQKYINGFEVGRFYNAYRYIYPIKSKNNKHLGSIEVSYIAQVFIEDIFKTYNVLGEFYLKKDVIDKKVFKGEETDYFESDYKGYYSSFKILKDLKKIKKIKKIKTGIKTPKELINIAIKKINKNKSFSLYAAKNNQIITFISVLNPISGEKEALITIKTMGTYIKELNTSFKTKFILLVFLIFIIVFLIYRELKNQKIKNIFLEEKIKERTKELESGKSNLEKKVKEIEKINKKLEDYSYTISHDLKEPIRSIRTFSEFILEDNEKIFNDETQNYFTRIIQASTKMAMMIDDLLILSRIGKKDIEFCNISINKIIEDVENTLKQKIEETNTIILKKELPKVFCQATWMEAIFQNLLTNSIKYNDKKERIIEISYKNTDKYHEFSVKDNGNGIPNDQFDKIFGLFRKAHQNKNINGSGAGLAIVSSAIDFHNGKIWVDWSEIDKGSIFKFIIAKNLGINNGDRNER